MKSRLIMPAAAVFTAMALGAPAPARAGDQQAADALQRALHAILPLEGELARFITIKPTWRSYEMRIDPPLLLQEILPLGVTTTGLQSFYLELSPQPAGTWGIEHSGPYDIKAKFGAGSSAPWLAYKAGNIALSAQLSADLRTQPKLKSTISDFDLSYWTPSSRRARTVGTMYVDQTMSNVTPDTLDLDLATTEVRMRDWDGTVNVSANKVTTDLKAKGVAYRALQNLTAEWLTLVQRKHDVLDIADKLRPALKKIMPVATEISQTGILGDVIYSDSNEEFGVDRVEYGIAATGLTGNAHIEGQVLVEGIDARGRLPPTTARLLPTRTNIAFTVDGLNVQKPWEYVVDGANFRERRWLNDNQQELAINYLIPDKTINVTFSEGRLSSDFYEVNVTGILKFHRKAVPPDMTIRVTTPSLDAVVKHLQSNAKRLPELGQYAFFALMVQGFAAKTDDGSLYWDLVMTEDGRVTVNGREFAPPRQGPQFP